MSKTSRDLGEIPDYSIDRLLNEFLADGSDKVLSTASSQRIRELLGESLPVGGQSMSSIIEGLRETLGKFRRNNAHPGMFAYVASPGLGSDPLAFALVALLNQNVTGFHSSPAATEIERCVVKWIAGLLDFPAESEGLFLSGGSWANLTALSVAINSAKENYEGKQLVVLAASSVHFSIPRALKVMGLGDQAIQYIELNENLEMDSSSLEKAIVEIESTSSKRVACIVATAGTTESGAIDPLDDLSQICAKHSIWFHVDAAYGGAMLLDEGLRSRLKGIERADSVTIDFHKWNFSAFDASLLVYKNADYPRKLFSIDAGYARFDDSPDEEYHFFDLSPETSRRARAIPVYIAWHYYGVEAIANSVVQSVKLAAYLAGKVEEAEDLCLVSRPKTSICCFRYVPKGVTGSIDLINDLNDSIVAEINAGGNFLVSPTKMRCGSVIRVCICNYSTRESHIDEFLDFVVEAGSKRFESGSKSQQ